MEVGRLVKEVVVAADMVALGEYLRTAFLGLIQSEEKHGCHNAARVVWVAAEEGYWRSRMRMQAEIDFRKLIGNVYYLADKLLVYMADRQNRRCWAQHQ